MIMNKSDLVTVLAERCDFLNKEKCDVGVRLLLDAMADALRVHRRVEIRGFGSFGVSFFEARTARNPRSGVPVDVPARYMPHFRSGKDVRDRVCTDLDHQETVHEA
jgi:integration host factor subunit beta